MAKKYVFKSETSDDGLVLKVLDGEQIIWSKQYPSYYEHQATGALIEDPTIIEQGLIENSTDVSGIERLLKKEGVISEDDQVVPFVPEPTEFQHEVAADDFPPVDLSNAEVNDNFTLEVYQKEGDKYKFSHSIDGIIIGILPDGGITIEDTVTGAERAYTKSFLQNSPDKNYAFKFFVWEAFEDGGELSEKLFIAVFLTKDGSGGEFSHFYSREFEGTLRAATDKALNTLDKVLQAGLDGYAIIRKKYVTIRTVYADGTFNDGDSKRAAGGPADSKFNILAKKVSRHYIGKPVPRKYQEKYGKVYGRADAMAVGYAVAAKIAREKGRFEKGGTLHDGKQLGDYIKEKINSRPAYDILETEPGPVGTSTWTEGASYPLALAIQKAFGGDLVTIVDGSGVPQHVMVEYDGIYLDADGFGTAKNKLRIQIHQEGVSSPKIVEFDKNNLGSIGVGSPELVDKVAAFLTSELGTDVLAKGGPVYFGPIYNLAKGGMFYSPNETNLSFDEAQQKIKEEEHRYFKSITDSIDEELEIKTINYNAVGDWVDGAENSIFSDIIDVPDYSILKYSAALKGLIGNQKAVLIFMATEVDQADDGLFVFIVNKDIKETRKILTDNSLSDRTLIKVSDDRTKVIIFDKDLQKSEKIIKFISDYGNERENISGRGEVFGNEASRAIAQRMFENCIRETEVKRVESDRLYQRYNRSGYEAWLSQRAVPGKTQGLNEGQQNSTNRSEESRSEQVDDDEQFAEGGTLSETQAKVEELLTERQKSKTFKDVGKRVAGSKKERRAYTLITMSDMADLEMDEATAIDLVVKDKVYPEVNVIEERQNGVSSGAAYLKVEMRKACGSKPPNDKTKRAAFVKVIGRLTDALKAVKTVEDFEQYLDSLKSLPVHEIAEYFVPTYGDLTEEQAEKFKKEVAEKVFRGSSSYSVFKKLLEEVFGKRFQNFLYKSSDSAIATFTEARKYQAVSEQQSKEWISKFVEQKNKFIAGNQSKLDEYKVATEDQLKTKFREWQGMDRFKKDLEAFREASIKYYQKRIDEANSTINNIPDGLKPRSDDWSWFDKEPAGKTGEKTKTTEFRINQGIPLSYIKRTGGLVIAEEYLNTAESTSTEENPITRDFGFKSVQFGNAITNLKSREHVRHFLGAMADISDILDINIKHINAIGGLSIAFAARGSGKAAAHYEPGHKIINVTNSRGDGFIAHEFGHYIDNAVTMLRNEGLSIGFGSNITMSKGTWREPSRKVIDIKSEELGQAMDAIMEFIQKGKPGITPQVIRAYDRMKLEKVPRYYDQVENTFKDVVPMETFEETISYLKERTRVLQEMMYDRINKSDLQARIIGYLANHFDMDVAQVLFNTSTSAFKYYSLQMSSGYWVEPWELFARAWECYIFDKLDAAGRMNNYLVSGEMFNLQIPILNSPLGYTYVYPMGDERKHLFTLYDHFITVLKKEYNLGGFVPFTDKRADEYISLDEKDGDVKNGVIVEQKTKKKAVAKDGMLIAKFDEPPAMKVKRGGQTKLAKLLNK